jgi:hypothetical protein
VHEDAQQYFMSPRSGAAAAQGITKVPLKHAHGVPGLHVAQCTGEE